MEYITSYWSEIVGTLLGFLYLYYELRASKHMFPIGMLMSAFYVGIFYSYKFYAFSIINVYFFFMQIYAWCQWGKAFKQYPLRRTPIPTWIGIAGVTGVTFLALWWILTLIPKQSDVAWGDSLITTLNAVALWMLSKKYIEQWILLIIANAFSVVLFYCQGLHFTTILYLVYLVASFLGYNTWVKYMKQESKTEI